MPRAPPFDQRSCWKIPTRLLLFVGLTSIHGSTSLFRYTVPDCVATPSAVQPTNGLTPDACTSGPLVNVLAEASPTAHAKASTKGGTARKPRFLRAIAIPLHSGGGTLPEAGER